MNQRNLFKKTPLVMVKKPVEKIQDLTQVLNYSPFITREVLVWHCDHDVSKGLDNW
jgi:hypothetical protein